MMNTDTILINGKKITTLKEFLRPGLKVVFVGINPSPVSVKAGHYYQGALGRRFWGRLQKYGLVSYLPVGAEDDAAFSQNIGFADMVRRPTSSAKDLTPNEIREGALSLIQRLDKLGKPRPIIVFVFARTAKECESSLIQAGFQTFRMPGPYAKREDEQRIMRSLARQFSHL